MVLRLRAIQSRQFDHDGLPIPVVAGVGCCRTSMHQLERAPIANRTPAFANCSSTLSWAFFSYTFVSHGYRQIILSRALTDRIWHRRTLPSQRTHGPPLNRAGQNPFHQAGRSLTRHYRPAVQQDPLSSSRAASSAFRCQVRDNHDLIATGIVIIGGVKRLSERLRQKYEGTSTPEYAPDLDM